MVDADQGRRDPGDVLGGATLSLNGQWMGAWFWSQLGARTPIGDANFNMVGWTQGYSQKIVRPAMMGFHGAANS